MEERVPKHVPEASALGITVKGGETDHFVAVANDFDVGRAEPENKEEPKSKAKGFTLSKLRRRLPGAATGLSDTGAYTVLVDRAPERGPTAGGGKTIVRSFVKGTVKGELKGVVCNARHKHSGWRGSSDPRSWLQAALSHDKRE